MTFLGTLTGPVSYPGDKYFLYAHCTLFNVHERFHHGGRPYLNHDLDKMQYTSQFSSSHCTFFFFLWLSLPFIKCNSFFSISLLLKYFNSNSGAALGEWKDNFIKCPREALNWSERKYLILEEILTYCPDILCLQEVDHYFDTFQPVLSGLGYHSTFFPKPLSPCLDVEHNNGPDGCALFFLRERFELIDSVSLRLVAKLLQTNQVAIIQTLRCIETSRIFCIAVTHLKACSGWERFRSSQGCDLLQNLENITGAGTPLIVCGDFNAEPTEDVYKQFTKSSLNLNSAYKLLSEDGQSEPPFTTWKIRPSGESCHTLDYIWYSQHAFAVNRLLNLPTEEQIGPNRLPSFHYPSDHLSLICEFSFLDQLD